MSALRFLGAAAAAVILVLAPMTSAQSPPPEPQTPPTPNVAPPVEEATPAPDGVVPSELTVDVITSAGVNKGPPKREASINMESSARKVRWDPAWTRFELSNYIGTGVLLATTLGSLAIPPVEDRWLQRNTFDVRARNVFRPKTLSGRATARDASDITLLVSTNLLLVDTLIVAWWGHDAGDMAWEMAAMSVEALAFNNAINGLVSAFASRQRPYAADLCTGEVGDKLIECTSSKRYRSFFSGHSSTTFAVAGVTCMHHAHVPLWGGGPPDAFACASAFGIAAATAMLRVVGDQHWTSDILVGSAFGTFSGLFVPWLLHYRTGDLPEAPDPDAISFQLVPTPTGAHLTGAF